MKVKLQGIRDLDFKSADGAPIKGVQFFVSFPENGVLGEMVDKLFLHDDFAIPDCKPGDILDISFNRKGKPESIKLISKQS